MHSEIVVTPVGATQAPRSVVVDDGFDRPTVRRPTSAVATSRARRLSLRDTSRVIARVGRGVGRAMAMPRTEESRPDRRDGRMAREMRKLNHAAPTAAVVLLLCWGVRLLVCHGRSNGGARFLPPGAVDPSHRRSPLKESWPLTMGVVA